MRLSHHSAVGLLLGSGLALSGAVASVACNGDDFGGCQASRTCAPVGSAGSGITAGRSAGGEAGMDSVGSGKSGGKGGGGSGGSAGKSVSEPTGGSSGEDGTGGNSHPTAGRGGSGGTGGTGGARGSSMSDAGADPGGDGPDTGVGGSSTSHGEAGMGGDDGSTAPPGDTTPPTITTLLPANGAKGVHDDIDIVITFSESMDNASTEAAYHSDQLPPDSVELFWKNDSKELVVHPNEVLAYADVDGPAGDAKAYVLTIDGTAKDLAGNPLGADQTFAFTTLRHITDSIPLAEQAARQIVHPKNGTDTTSVACGDLSTGIVKVGATDGDDSLLVALAFDLSTIPDGVVRWGHAWLDATLSSTGINPFGDDRLGDLEFYGVVGTLGTLGWNTVPTTDLGAYSTYATYTAGHRVVLPALTSDYEHRTEQGNTSEYLFQFDRGYDGDDTYVKIGCGSLKLSFDYIAP